MPCRVECAACAPRARRQPATASRHDDPEAVNEPLRCRGLCRSAAAVCSGKCFAVRRKAACVNEQAEHLSATCGLDVEHAGCLRQRQPETGHLPELGKDAHVQFQVIARWAHRADESCGRFVWTSSTPEPAEGAPGNAAK